MTVTYTTLTVGRPSTEATYTVGRASTEATFTVRGNLGAIVGFVAPAVDLVLETETGDYLTTDTGAYLAYA